MVRKSGSPIAALEPIHYDIRMYPVRTDSLKTIGVAQFNIDQPRTQHGHFRVKGNVSLARCVKSKRKEERTVQIGSLSLQIKRSIQVGTIHEGRSCL